MWRRLLGPSEAEIWTEFSRKLGGRYEKKGLFRSGRAVLPHHEWQITIDEFTVHVFPILMIFIRLRASYVNLDGFRFRIYRKSGFSALGRLFGVQDLEISDPSFDRRFVVQGTAPAQVRRLLTNQRIKDLMECQRDIQLEVKRRRGWFRRRFPRSVDELYLRSAGSMSDVYHVHQLFKLFCAVLDELCIMGSASATKPFSEGVTRQ
jgi:hypothetical protein